MSRQNSRSAFLVAAAGLVLLAGCGSDSRTEKIEPGLSRDSALAILRQPIGDATAADSATPGDSLKNVWRRTAYLVRKRQIEVIWYSPTGEKRTAADTVPEGRVIPVVLIDGQVIGVGRTVYDQLAAEYGLPKNRY